MEDTEIIRLLFERDERSLAETEKKYGGLILSVASNILKNREDCEECLNEVMLRLWNSVPPVKPERLSAYLAKLARNKALDMIDVSAAAKRQSERYAESYEELSEALSSGFDIEKEQERLELDRIINRFLASLPRDERMVFTGRYFFFDTYDSICRKTGLSMKKVRNLCEKSRKKLAELLKKEGYHEN